MSVRFLLKGLRLNNFQSSPISLSCLQREQKGVFESSNVIQPKIPFDMPLVHYTEQSIVVIEKKSTSK